MKTELITNIETKMKNAHQCKKTCLFVSISALTLVNITSGSREIGYPTNMG